jgi:hypothetical protein
MVSASYIERNDFAVKAHQAFNFIFFSLPLVSFSLDGVHLVVEFALHVEVEPLQELVVGDQISAHLLVLTNCILEHVIHLVDVILEHLLNLPKARSPKLLHFANS